MAKSFHNLPEYKALSVIQLLNLTFLITHFTLFQNSVQALSTVKEYDISLSKRVFLYLQNADDKQHLTGRQYFTIVNKWPVPECEGCAD